MSVSKSLKIDAFFYPYQNSEWFYEFIDQSQVHDGVWIYGDSETGTELIEIGINLAQKAANRPLWSWSDEDGDNVLYFIGAETEILKKLKKALKTWFQFHPQASKDKE